MAVMVYDIETLRLAEEVDGGWENSAGMGFGTCCMYDYSKDQYFFFGAHQRELCQDLLSGNTVVSFNGIRFDNCIVHDQNDYKSVWKDIDLFDLLVRYKFNGLDVAEAKKKHGFKKVFDRSLNLDAVCVATFGVGKSGKGALAPQQIKDGQWAEVFAYNLQDVRRTRQLFEFIGREGYCIDGKGNRINVVSLKGYRAS